MFRVTAVVPALWAAVATGLFVAAANAQRVVSVGFEERGGRSDLDTWQVAGRGIAIGYDSLQPAAGMVSLRTRRLDATSDSSQIIARRVLSAAWAHGRRLRLTGYIRTEMIRTGYASYWMRVDGPGFTALARENMEDRAPRGTTPWTRYEIELPVDSAATSVSVGLYHRGDGSAWFDSVTLEVVGAPMPRAVAAFVPPPRPPEDMTRLLTDEELALPPDNMMVSEDSAYSRWIRSHAVPIRSLGASDFSDLRFLAPLLSDKRIVQLGESSHGVAEFNLGKVRLIRYLHEELGYDVIAFESPFVACERAQQHSAMLSPIELMRACLFGVWHSEEVLPLFEYIQETQRTDRPLFLAGFDIQPLANSRFNGDTDIPMVARQVAKSNQMYERQRATTGPPGDIRDLGMADNLEFLLNERYPGKKLMVWAHNGHIRHTREARSDSAQPQRAIMGTWLAQRRRRELYTIGLYMYRGSAADNHQIPYPIRQAPTGSLESILHQAPWRYSFVDFSQASRERGSEWMWSAIDAREMGMQPTRLVPRAAYDAVLFIDTAHPPSYR